jgi:hypothetical protein
MIRVIVCLEVLSGAGPLKKGQFRVLTYKVNHRVCWTKNHFDRLIIRELVRHHGPVKEIRKIAAVRAKHP